MKCYDKSALGRTTVLLQIRRRLRELDLIRSTEQQLIIILIIICWPSDHLGIWMKFSKKWWQNAKNCLPVKETRNNLRLGPSVGRTADMFAIYLFKFYFSNCTCSFVGNLMKFELNTKQCDELTLGDDDTITVVRKWGICSRGNFCT